ncbi:DNAI1 protein, partial [Copsychus sechellarum]|nr:DNAI1 protein [Copsychus sechellarum]
ELKAEITRTLTADNPHIPRDIVRFSFTERAYKLVDDMDQTTIHFTLNGYLIHKDSDEGRRQSIRSSTEAGSFIEEAPVEASAEATEEAETKDEEPTEEADLNNGTAESFNAEIMILHAFSFFQEKGLQTDPAPIETFSENVNQWCIYDAYMEELERMEKAKEKEKAKPVAVKKEETQTGRKLSYVEPPHTDSLSKVAKAAKIAERMVNLNTFDDIAQDFKYFEDASDEFRGQEGTLLPLWKFQSEKTKKLAVTAISWNPKYKDLFAVGYGSCNSDTSQGPSLLAVLQWPWIDAEFPDEGLYSLAGASCRKVADQSAWDNSKAAGGDKCSHQQASGVQTSCSLGRISEDLVEVKWQKDDMDNNSNFFSVSSDGRIVSWTLVKVNSRWQFLFPIDYLFLVGTEEGKIYKCSKSYSSQYLDVFEAHHMAVDSVSWNPFHLKVFISCSSDWTVKIWDHTIKTPMFVYDLSTAVGDVAWSPYSSTVFAAVTIDGQAHVFDLNVNKLEPLCTQLVVTRKKNKTTHVQFNPVHPIIVVGDERGLITCLKLSPNLRKKPREKKGQETKKGPEVEIEKLEKLLSMVREPGSKE